MLATCSNDIFARDSGMAIAGIGKIAAMTRKNRTPYGSRLVQARKQAGLGQVELARRVGIAQSTLAAAEWSALGSRHTPKIAKVLGVNPVWLQNGTGPRGPDERSEPDLFSAPVPVFADAPIVAPEKQKSEDALSPLALELAAMFDKLQSRVDRAEAYTAAMQEILRVLTERDAAPTHMPTRTAHSEKQHG